MRKVAALTLIATTIGYPTVDKYPATLPEDSNGVVVVVVVVVDVAVDVCVREKHCVTMFEFLLHVYRIMFLKSRVNTSLHDLPLCPLNW